VLKVCRGSHLQPKNTVLAWLHVSDQWKESIKGTSLFGLANFVTFKSWRNSMSQL